MMSVSDTFVHGTDWKGPVMLRKILINSMVIALLSVPCIAWGAEEGQSGSIVSSGNEASSGTDTLSITQQVSLAGFAHAFSDTSVSVSRWNTGNLNLHLNGYGRPHSFAEYFVLDCIRNVAEHAYGLQHGYRSSLSMYVERCQSRPWRNDCPVRVNPVRQDASRTSTCCR